MAATYPDKRGRFGEFGGKYVPETLMSVIEELEQALDEALADESFVADYHEHLREYAGRPTALSYASNLTAIIRRCKNLFKA